ncbi:MAG: hypothetical protein U9O85_09450 [Euryarchaeota archaeon]|nr:hypothetical protein [Euryarchaeota archaeon]
MYAGEGKKKGLFLDGMVIGTRKRMVLHACLKLKSVEVGHGIR